MVDATLSSRGTTVILPGNEKRVEIIFVLKLSDDAEVPTATTAEVHRLLHGRTEVTIGSESWTFDETRQSDIRRWRNYTGPDHLLRIEQDGKADVTIPCSFGPVDAK